MANLGAHASAAVAILSAAGDPERTKAAIARIEEKEGNAREAARIARLEITLLEKTRKELDARAKALEVAQAKSEQDLAARQTAVDKLEASLKKREKTLKDDRTTLRGEQTAHKLTSRLDMDRLKNLEVALSNKDKLVKKDRVKAETLAKKAEDTLAAANAVKSEYEDKAAKLTDLLKA